MIKFKVSAEGNVNSVAAAVAGAFEDGASELCLQCIGARSVNTAVKSVATARNLMRTDGINKVLVMRPQFVNKLIRDKRVTAIELTVTAEDIQNDKTT